MTRLLRALLLLASAAPALSQTRPLITEAAATAPAGSLVFESGLDWISKEPNPITLAPRNRWDGPLLRFVYSPSANVELDLEWVAAVGVTGDPSFGSATDAGDVTLRAKLRMLEGHRSRPTLGARFTVSLPETKEVEGLGPDMLRMSAQLLVTQSLGGTTVHANAGLLIHDLPRRTAEQVDFFVWGAAVERRLGRGVVVLAEAAGRSGPGEPEARSRAEARAGARLGRNRLRADLAVRRGLSSADGDWGFTLGFSYSIRGG
jgi:hypothetical protein